jgi:hypothetical protein
VSDRDVPRSDLMEIAKRNGDFRKNCLSGFPLPAFDKCSSVSTVLVASLDGAIAAMLGFWPR